ncbi:hypothetical protein AB4Y96_16400 [Phyllobacterium sp. TAF24]|uniref:hypothetical protein n=1 Tax=Phyllobacterium sp. TAF24 TaxID=3233068 RepID=UPI003F9D674B
MERARSYKHRTEAPSNDVWDSFASTGGATTAGSAGASGLDGGESVGGGAFNGTTVSGDDFSSITLVVGLPPRLKQKSW